MCSKSCAALDLLQDNGLELQIQDYIHDMPSKDELIELLTLLKPKPLGLIR
ncbi:hypothetical protein LZQ00_10990 [Sphingobacterium sp. SRCM116780]|uniref:hypothetical protein n=1 Tax=Sphingobacterium sp. SRCM116780 TaxID=2907623 RepID=UPI001F312840|nr:hypothetical protein [Sphingobacterium sp. SRCM116780]UIR54802.1 hypothetical protein LZQ00_10990 [Sphingobacterium sp. SRCM116780]